MNISKIYTTKIQILDCLIVSVLAITIFINIAKAYIFLQPKINTPLFYFWERGSVKREIQTGLIYVTNVSYYLLGISFLAILAEFFLKTFLLLRNKFTLKMFLIQQALYFILFCVALWALIKSWDGVIP